MRKLLAPLALLLIGALQAASAGENLWTATGPSGAFVYDIAYIDDANGVAVAVTANSIYRTTNHGASWTLSRMFGNVYPAYVAVNPANRNQVVVFADTLWRSVDGGATFSVGGTPGDLTGVQSVAFGADGTLWAGYYGGFLRRSGDAGASWVFVSAPSNNVPNPVQVMTDATNENVIYAFTQDGPFRSDDRGVMWVPLSGTADLSQFSASRGTSGTLFAHRTTDYQAFRSLNFGATWQPIGTTPVSWITSATGSPARLLAVTNDIHALTSPDNGTTWSDLGRYPNAIPWAISFGPLNANRILLATGAGVIATSDGGATWEERNTGINQVVATALLPPVAGSDALHVVTADLQSIYRRDAATGNWTGIGRTSTPVLGYPGNSAGGYQVAIAPSDVNTLYMARDGSFGRSTDGGVNWVRCSAVTTTANRIAVNPANAQVVYLGARGAMFNDPSLFKTINGGRSWTPLTLGVSDVVDVAIDPQQPNIVYALSSGQGFNSGLPVSRSIDGGATWRYTGWQASSNYLAHAMALDPSAPSTIYVGLDDSMYRSTDSGATWTRLSPFVISTIGVRHIVIDPQSPEILYVIGAHGANYARSVDRGATWEPLRNDTPDSSIVSLNSLALAPGHNARLIGIRAGAGLQEVDVTPWVGLTSSTAAMTAGSESTVTLTVTNAGLLTATRARVTGTLVAATGAYTVTSTAATCAVAIRELTCDIGLLRPAATLTIDIRFTPASAGTWSAALGAYEPLTGGLTQTVTVAAAPAPPAPPSGGGVGGGGGGGLDFLLLALLGAMTLRGAARRH